MVLKQLQPKQILVKVPCLMNLRYRNYRAAVLHHAAPLISIGLLHQQQRFLPQAVILPEHALER